MKKLLIATTNVGKLKEISSFLSDLPLEIISLSDLGITDDVEEDQWEYLIAGTIETPGTQQDLIDIIETLLSKRT